MKVKITEEIYNNAKEAQDSGVNSAEFIEDSGIPGLTLIQVNDIYGSDDWESYVHTFGSVEQRDALKIQTPTQSGFYKAVIAKKAIESSNLGEEIKWLLEKIKFLQKAVQFEEQRKIQLEEANAMLERNIKIGIKMMEEIENSKEFKKIAAKNG